MPLSPTSAFTSSSNAASGINVASSVSSSLQVASSTSAVSLPLFLDSTALSPHHHLLSLHAAALISKATIVALESFAEAESNKITTPIAPILAAFSVLVARYARTERFLIGAVMGADGIAPDPENVSVVSVPVELRGRESFVSLAEKVEGRLQDAFQRHQQATSESEGFELSASQTIPLLCGVQMDESENWSPLLTATSSTLPSCQLAIHIDITNGNATAIYDASSLTQSSVSRLLSHLSLLIDSSMGDPLRTPVARLPMITEPERVRALVDWNRTGSASGNGGRGSRSSSRGGLASGIKSLISVFEEVAGRLPFRPCVAVSGGGDENERGVRVLTYASLNARANRFARYLSKVEGLKPGQTVAVLAASSSSQDFITASLAVLKLGCIIVPIGDEYPAEWINDAIRSAEAVAAIQCTTTTTRPAPLIRTVNLPSIAKLLESYEDSNTPQVVKDPTSPAYVFVTNRNRSGIIASVITHTSIWLQASWHRDFAAVTDRDRIGIIAGMSSHAAVASLWSAFVAAASVEFLSLYTTAPASATPLTILHITAADLRRLVNDTNAPTSAWRVRTSKVRVTMVIVSSGESASSDTRTPTLPGRDGVVVPIPSRFEHPGLVVTVYGATECAAFAVCTGAAARDINIGGGGGVVVGRPVGGAQLFVLDAELQPVPAGVVGEVYISGEIVGKGYRGPNSPALTQSRFMRNPFTANQLMFRTCDWGVQSQRNGFLQLVATRRTPSSKPLLVSPPGFIIDGSEIEESVVVAANDSGSFDVLACFVTVVSNQLVAVVVTRNNDRRVDHLRDIVATSNRLPACLVPTVFVLAQNVVEASSWMKDHTVLAALMRPDTPFTDRRDDSASPVTRTPSPVFLTALSVTDTSRSPSLVRRTPPPPPIDTAATASSVGDHARVVRPTVFDGLRNSFFSLVASVAGGVDLKVLEAAVDAAARRHGLSSLLVRMTVPGEGFGDPVGFAAARDVVFKADDSGSESVGVRAWIFTFERAVEGKGLGFVVRVSRRFADSWSMNLLFNDLCVSYSRLSRSKSAFSVSVPASASFVTFASAFEKRLESVREEQMDYWRDKLRLSEGEIYVRVGNSGDGSGRRISTVGEVRFDVDRDLAGKVKDFSRKMKCTVNNVYLVALGTLLNLWAPKTPSSSTRSVLIAQPVTLRRTPETVSTVGPLTNVALIRSDISDGVTTSLLLQSVKRSLLDAIVRVDVPIADVIRENSVVGAQVLFGIVPPPPSIGSSDGDTAVLTRLSSDFPVIDEPFELYVELQESVSSGGGLAGRVIFRSEVFGRETVWGFIGDYLRLMEEMIDSSVDRLVASFSLGRGLSRSAVTDSDVQNEMRKIVAGILGRSVAGGDDFFDAGGNSMLSLQLLHAVSRKFGIEISLAELFGDDDSTPDAMARRVKGVMTSGRDGEADSTTNNAGGGAQKSPATASAVSRTSASVTVPSRAITTTSVASSPPQQQQMTHGAVSRRARVRSMESTILDDVLDRVLIVLRSSLRKNDLQPRDGLREAGLTPESAAEVSEGIERTYGVRVTVWGAANAIEVARMAKDAVVATGGGEEEEEVAPLPREAVIRAREVRMTHGGTMLTRKSTVQSSRPAERYSGQFVMSPVEVPASSAFMITTSSSLASTPVASPSVNGTSPLHYATAIPTRGGGAATRVYDPSDPFREYQLSPLCASFINPTFTVSSNPNLAVVLRVKGRIDVDELQEAMIAVARRHPILRSRIVREKSLSVSQFPSSPKLSVIELARPVSDSDISDAVSSSSAVHPPMRAVLLNNSIASSCVLCVVFASALVDSASAQLVTNEILQSLDGLVPGADEEDPSAIDLMAVAHVNYSRQVEYWRWRLAGFRPPVFSGSGGGQDSVTSVVTGAIGLGLSARVMVVCSTRGWDQKHVIASCLVALLKRYLNGADLAVGIVVGERPGSVGRFETLVPIRCAGDLNCNSSFDEFVSAVRRFMKEAVDNADVSEDVIQGLVGGDRNACQAALLFDSSRISSRRLQRAGIEVSQIDVPGIPRSLDRDLTFHLADDPAEGILITVEHKADVFSATTVESMIGHYVRLLETCLADPEAPIGDAPILSRTEMDAIVHVFNSPLSVSSRSMSDRLSETVCQIFERVAETKGEHPAVVSSISGATMSYSELDVQSNRFARYLASLKSFALGTFIITLLPRSAASIVAAMGILKAGAVCVPIDPYEDGVTGEWVQAVKSATAATSIVIDSVFAGLVIGIPDELVVAVDVIYGSLQAVDGSSFTANFEDGAIAYAFYTRSADGLPVGAYRTHRGLINDTLWSASEDAALLVSDRVLLASSPSSHQFQLELWPTLLAGCTGILADNDLLKNPDESMTVFAEWRLSVIHLSAELWKSFSKRNWATVECARLVVAHGAVDESTWSGCGFRLVTLYTPCIDAGVSLINAPEPGEERPSAGRPSNEVRCFILDSDRRIMPVDMVGELCVAGEGVTSEELLPAKTASYQWIGDPFGNGSVFSTGVKARWRPSGKIEIVPQADYLEPPMAAYASDVFALEHGELMDDQEQIIFDVVSRVIGVETFSINRNIFHIPGCDVFKASLIVSKLRDELSIPISLRYLYDNPSVKSLSDAISANRDVLLALGRPDGQPVVNKDFILRSDFHTSHLYKSSASRRTISRFCLQSLGLLILFVISIINIVPPVALVVVIYLKFSLPIALGCLPAAYLGWSVISALTLITTKWILVGRYRSGTYPLWGQYHFRWWVVDRLQSQHKVCTAPLRGSLFLNIWLRLLGAKIDQRVQIDTDDITEFDLVTVGEGARIAAGARISPALIENGSLVLRRVKILKHCDIGPRCVISAGVTISPYATLGALSAVPYSAKIPPHSHFAGSPLRQVYNGQSHGTHNVASTSARTTLFQGLSLLLICILSGLSMAPAATLAHYFFISFGLLWTVTILPVLWLMASTIHAIVVIIVRRVSATQMNVDAEAVEAGSSEALRAWFNRALLAGSALKPFLDHFSGSVVINWFYRALGARIGRNVFIHISQDSLSTLNLLNVGDGAIVLGGRTSILCEYHDGDIIHRGPITIGESSVVGDGSLLLAGANVAQHAVLGPRTLLTENEDVKIASQWVGSPACVVCEASDEVVAEAVRLRGGRAAERWPWLLVESLGQLIAPLLALALPLPATFVIGIIITGFLGPWSLLYLSPLGVAIFSFMSFVVVMILKWTLIGRLKTDTSFRLFSSRFLGVTLFASIQRLAFTIILDRIKGTDFLVAAWRLLGASVGEGVYIATVDLFEYDLISIGDGAVIGEDAVLAGMMIDSRGLSLTSLSIEADANVGSHAVILPGGTVRERALLGPGSTCMPGEVLTADQSWEGSPAESQAVKQMSVIVDEEFGGGGRTRRGSGMRRREGSVQLSTTGSVHGGEGLGRVMSITSVGGRTMSVPAPTSTVGGRSKDGSSVAGRSSLALNSGVAPSIMSTGLAAGLGTSVVKRRAGPQNVFLTGATGFVGSYLLDKLLMQGHQVYCLVRAESREHGQARIRSTLDLHGLWRASYEYSILPVIGDMSRDSLGLDVDQWDHLARTMDIVVHCAALVDYHLTVEELFGPNVQGTRNMIDFALHGRIKPFHYMSALSVFNPIADLRIEEKNVPTGKGLYNGYRQSKFAAEMLVAASARKVGHPCWIYRLGRITGHSITGAIPAQDLPFLLVKGIIELGCFPMDLNAPVDVMPVDHCTEMLAHFIRRSMTASTIVRRSRSKQATVYHITHPSPTTLPQMCAWLADKGYALEGVSYARWRERLMAAAESPDTSTTLTPFLATFEPGLVDARWARFRCERTLRDAEAGGFRSRVVDIDAHLVGSYIDHLVSSGALEPPRGAPMIERRVVSPIIVGVGGRRRSSVAASSSASGSEWGGGGGNGGNGVGGGRLAPAPASSVGSTVVTQGSTAPILARSATIAAGGGAGGGHHHHQAASGAPPVRANTYF